MTHKQLSDRLGVSIVTVAIVREVRRGASAQSQRALGEESGNILEAAKWLAGYWRCWAACDEMNPQLVERIKEADGE